MVIKIFHFTKKFKTEYLVYKKCNYTHYTVIYYDKYLCILKRQSQL